MKQKMGNAIIDKLVKNGTWTNAKVLTCNTVDVKIKLRVVWCIIKLQSGFYKQ